VTRRNEEDFGLVRGLSSRNAARLAFGHRPLSLRLMAKIQRDLDRKSTSCPREIVESRCSLCLGSSPPPA
jgi:hypothetical protein